MACKWGVPRPRCRTTHAAERRSVIWGSLMNTRLKLGCGLIVALSALAVTSASTEDGSTERDAAAAQLRKVDVSDGVSRSEASAIAEFFFYYHEGVGCGAPGPISNEGGNWRIGTRFGFAGEPGASMIISKSSGSVHWGGQLCVTNPHAMLNDPKNASRCRLTSR